LAAPAPQAILSLLLPFVRGLTWLVSRGALSQKARELHIDLRAKTRSEGWSAALRVGLGVGVGGGRIARINSDQSTSVVIDVV